MKKIILNIANVISVFWKLIPTKLRTNIFTGLMILESRNSDPKKGIINLFNIKDKLEWIINERALAIGHGEHPKHYLINYHKFFIDRIKNGEKVLDIGCGYGSVAYSIANFHKKSQVLGVDMDDTRLKQAIESKKLKNLNFFSGDATENLPSGDWNVVVLSNVLEHIQKRDIFLKKIKEKTKAKTFLIRVPLFERDWQIPLRKELKIDYYNDIDHKIEHTIAEFENEMKNANLTILELHTKWGEIWACCSERA
jgi:SAM-dependent methyltransferase